MYAAINGLKTHMQKLNVIGNNIANVNTYGYKAGRTVFETSLYTSLNSGSNGTSTVGGRNPSQIGYGVSVGSVDIDMSTGNYSPTGKATDCMIDGDGFFLVGDKTVAEYIDGANAESLKSLTLTRVGNFEFKADGHLTDGNGNVVYGFLSTGVAQDGTTPVVCDQLVPIRYPRMSTVDVGTPGGADYVPAGSVLYPSVNNGVLTDNVGAGTTENPFCLFDSVSIDPSTGKITGITQNTNEVITIGFIAVGQVTNPNGVTQMSETYYKCGDGAGSLSIAVLGGAANDVYTDAAGTNRRYR